MGQTIKKIVDELREELSGFRMSDDTILPDHEFFIDKINEYRASVIREMDVIPESMYTTTCCHQIVCVGQTCTLNGRTFKSKNKLFQVEVPDLIDGVGNKDIIYFGLDGFSLDFTRVSLRDFIRTGYLEFGGNMPIYARIGNVIIVKNIPNDSLFFVCMTALQLHPTSSCGYEENTPYPASESVMARVKRLVKMDVLSAMGYPKDFISDALPAMQQPAQPQANGSEE